MPVDVEKLKAMAPPAGLPFGFRARARRAQRPGPRALDALLHRGARFQGVGRLRREHDRGRHGVPPLQHRSSFARAGRQRARPSNRVDLNHLAFEAATLDELFRFRDHLRKHGVKIIVHGRRRAGCQIAVEFFDPDNHHVELYWGLDQVGTDGRVRPREWREFHSLEERSTVRRPARTRRCRTRRCERRGPWRRLNRSHAATSAALMPGSQAEWPASGTTW